MTDVIFWGTQAAVVIALGIKWLRVAQREHYIPTWVTRIALGWGNSVPMSSWPLALAAVLWVASMLSGVVALQFASLAVGVLWPWGLGFRGTSSPLQWTSRARRLAAVWFVVAGVTSVVFGPFIVIVCAPILMDAAVWLAKPVEKSLSRKWLVAAQRKLRQVGPTVVAVTGSYGKTSTKGYIAHLVGTKFSVVPSPASFNNLMGLARAVNDKLTPGTEVFVAEMGVYGEGEIRELSKSFPPDIAAITTIGEAHLERMKNRATILRAKSEIVENAKTVVLPIDDRDLAELADRCEAQGKRVVRVSATGAKADVTVDPASSTVVVNDESVPVTISGVGHAVNVAVAVGIAHALDVPLAMMATRLGSLPTAAHRAEPQQAPSGAIIIDDSYNANPTGAARAVEGGAALAKERGGEFIVVTPGMIELGPVQADRNREFARQIAAVGGQLLVVGHTNRRPLLSGHPTATAFAKRTDAMNAALQRAGASGVILVENDLPDHYA